MILYSQNMPNQLSTHQISGKYIHWLVRYTGLEINILRQWTTGPPALKIWWPSLKSGGPEIYAVIVL